MRFAAILLLLGFLVIGRCLADAGSPIPKPKQSIAQAVEIVQSQFLKTHPDSDAVKYSEFIVVKAEYNWIYGKKTVAEWSWFITLRHPIQNDVSFTYRVDPKGKLSLIEETV